MLEVVAPEKAGFSASRLERVNALMHRYVEGGKLAGTISLVYRRGQIVHLHCHGLRDREAGLPMQEDTLLRIYSMTKPITSVAALMLLEAGNLLLDDPIAKYIPAFADVQVYNGSQFDGLKLTAPDRAPTVQDLLRHTAGLSYGWFQDSPVEEVYRQGAKQAPPTSLADFADRVASVPLLYQPGTAWRYSFSTDILGRVVEVASGQLLDAFFQDEIFKPLGMTETAFQVPAGAANRFGVLYTNVEDYTIGNDPAQTPADAPLRVLKGPAQTQFLQTPRFPSGGGGLVSTTGDYLRFCQMLLNGGVLDARAPVGAKNCRTHDCQSPARGAVADWHWRLGESWLWLWPGGECVVGCGGCGRSRFAWELRLGWRCHNNLLDRPGRGSNCHFHDPVYAQWLPPDPARVSGGGLPSVGGLKREA